MAGKLVDAQPEQDNEFGPVDEDKTQDTRSEQENDNNNEGQEDDIPEKYKGKSLQEIVQMHQEAEKALGRQGNEVGELRKLIDQRILPEIEQRHQAAPQPDPEEEKVDWFSDPDKALEQRLNSHPKILEAEKSVQESRQKTALETLNKKHSDMNELLNSEDFAKWVNASKVRQQLFMQAHQNYDYEAADELFSTYKDLRRVKDEAGKVDEEAQKAQVTAASTGSARGTNPPARKKKYRRADIMRLRTTDPERYNQMADEFLLAYKEGRVI